MLNQYLEDIQNSVSLSSKIITQKHRADQTGLEYSILTEEYLEFESENVQLPDI